MSIQISVQNGEYRVKIMQANGVMRVFMTAASRAQVIEKLKGICNA